MPSLTNVRLPKAFEYRDDVTITGSTSLCILLSPVDIGAISQCLTYNECWSSRPVFKFITELLIGSNKCNTESIVELDLFKYPMLKSVRIGDESFMYVKKMKIIGLRELESVEIGMNSFTKYKNSTGDDPNRRLWITYCPSLRELRIGDYSFSDYSMIEIESVDALEVIEVGSLSVQAANFYYAPSLKLKSATVERE